MNTMGELPMGFGMLLSENPDAMQYFSSLSAQQQKEIIEQTHAISSRNEMRAFVSSLGQNGWMQDYALRKLSKKPVYRKHKKSKKQLQIF